MFWLRNIGSMRMSGILLAFLFAVVASVATPCVSQKVTDVEATIHVDPTVTGASVFISRYSTSFCTIEIMTYSLYENPMRWAREKAHTLSGRTGRSSATGTT